MMRLLLATVLLAASEAPVPDPLEPWGKFGLIGAAFGVLAAVIWKMFAELRDARKEYSQVIAELRQAEVARATLEHDDREKMATALTTLTANCAAVNAARARQPQ